MGYNDIYDHGNSTAMPFYRTFQAYSNQMPDLRAQMVPAYNPPYPAPDFFSREREQEADMERMKGMYPSVAYEVQKHVEEACDQMEYDGSLMFDEYPDRIMMSRVSMGVYDKVKHLYEEDAVNAAAVREDSETEANWSYKKAQSAPVQEELQAMGRRPEHRRREENWMRHLVDVLLFNEMYRRRCRRRNCRRW